MLPCFASSAEVSLGIPTAPPSTARVGVRVPLCYAEPVFTSRMAIIIDDLGRDARVFDALARAPLTLAVIPRELYSRETALEARRRGYEVILHLPMEPLRYPEFDPGKNALKPGMDARTVDALLDRAISEVPGARGLNNHMGSRATRDRQLMASLLRSARERSLYFIDSRTSSRSVAFATARELGVPAAARSVFLDTDLSPRLIRSRLRELEERAKREGFAIGIGHPFPETLDAIREILPGLARRGVKLVFASELAE